MDKFFIMNVHDPHQKIPKIILNYFFPCFSFGVWEKKSMLNLKPYSKIYLFIIYFYYTRKNLVICNHSFATTRNYVLVVTIFDFFLQLIINVHTLHGEMWLCCNYHATIDIFIFSYGQIFGIFFIQEISCIWDQNYLQPNAIYIALWCTLKCIITKFEVHFYDVLGLH
jgi:hypothetical protein